MSDEPVLSLAKDDDGLTARQRGFVDLYLIKPEKVEWCAVKAGYKDPKDGWKRCLNNKNVIKAIQKAREDRIKRIHLTQDRVVKELAVLALSNVGDYVEKDENGTIRIKDFDDIPHEKWAAVQSVKQLKDGQLDIKMHDKKGPLSDLAGHMGVLSAKQQPSDKDEDEKVIKIIDRRSKAIGGKTKVLEIIDEPKTLGASDGSDASLGALGEPQDP